MHHSTHLLYLPDRKSPRLFAWGTDLDALALPLGKRERVTCFGRDAQAQPVTGHAIELLEGLTALARLNTSALARLPASAAVWSLAAKFALDLVARGRIVPTLTASLLVQARWAVSLSLPEDVERFRKLAQSMPPAAHAVPIDTEDVQRSATQMWQADALLERFLNDAADLLVRRAMQHRADHRDPTQWEHRFRHALLGTTATFTTSGFAERRLHDELRSWTAPLAGTRRGEARVCFRLHLPENEAEQSSRSNPFRLQYLLQARSDPSLLVDAAAVFQANGHALQNIASSPQAAQEYLLGGLAIASRLFAPIEASLRAPTPLEVLLPPHEAWEFLKTAAPSLMEAGFGVLVPPELAASGQRRLRMRMRVGGTPRQSSGGASGHPSLSMQQLLHFEWQAELAGEPLTVADLQALAALKVPLVRHRGQWVAIDAAEVNEAIRLLERRNQTLTMSEALAAALGGAPTIGANMLPLNVAAEGPFAAVVERLRSSSGTEQIQAPQALRGTLRPYQLRGLAWLATMAELGLGTCLADDMGLGKTIQLIALLLHQREQQSLERPALLVCPTSVIGNWERELRKFAPTLQFVRHYGNDRVRDAASLAALPGQTLVLTTYGLLRRDAAVLRDVEWSAVALDEAQNIKNSASKTAQAARALNAAVRVALTGTPVENRLDELWSIFEFINPRLLGSQASFRREYVIPIERYGQSDVAERLRKVVSPFILRRLKSDRNIIRDLPDKQEMKVICSLTREQASLYRAAIDASLANIENSAGIERRGLVLALITELKQICNHPAQYLDETGPLAGRSGKMQRCIEMLEEVLASGDRALIFTQYSEMGSRLVAELQRIFGVEVPFLHGGVPRAKRDAMVQRFQEDPAAPQIFVLSVKAGGTGLNLTRANHVFHYDRWWNPAVEDQATDRAYRIGQDRSVQVHKLLCAGTIEEKVDALLEEKRDLAARIVGSSEKWLTELDNDALRELFSLSPDAVVSAEGDTEADIALAQEETV